MIEIENRARACGPNGVVVLVRAHKVVQIFMVCSVCLLQQQPSFIAVSMSPLLEMTYAAHT